MTDIQGPSVSGSPLQVQGSSKPTHGTVGDGIPQQSFPQEIVPDAPAGHPGYRASIDPGELKKPARRFKKDDPVELKATHAHYEVTGYSFNDVRNGWDYSLREASGGLPYPGWVKETEIKRRR